MKGNQTPKLYILPPSHYCERAKWALDSMSIVYTIIPWAVGPHILLARRRASDTTLPIMDTGGQVIQGSGRILDWVRIPGGDALIESRFEQRVGVLVRQFIYAGTLSRSESNVKATLFDGVRGGQRTLAELMWPVTSRMMIKAMSARPSMLASIQAELEDELEWFDSIVDDAIPKHQVSRVGITAASLLSPIVRPSVRASKQTMRLPREIEDILQKWKNRRSIRWVNDYYADFRTKQLVHKHLRAATAGRSGSPAASDR